MAKRGLKQGNSRKNLQSGDGRLDVDAEVLVAEIRSTYNWYIAKVVFVVVLVAVLTAAFICSMVYFSALEHLGYTTVAVAAVTFAVAVALFCIAAARSLRNLYKQHLEYVELLREVGPALADSGQISPLRWATIKIQLSQYGI